MTTSTSQHPDAPSDDAWTERAADDAALPPARGSLLADALSLNVLLSGLTGGVLLVGAPWLDEILGTPGWVVALVGMGLIVFAAFILGALTRPASLWRDAIAIVVADVGWIIATPFVLATDMLTPTGERALVVTTALVAMLAIEQVVGLVRSRGLDRAGVRPVHIADSRVVPARATTAWALVADAAGYAAFAPGLAAARTDGPLAEGMQRVCTDDDGNDWAETCTLVQPGREYRMTVDTSTYPWHFRVLLDSFGMAWRVTPRPDGSMIELSFGGGVLLGVIGRVVMGVWTRDDPVGTIIDRYVGSLRAG